MDPKQQYLDKMDELIAKAKALGSGDENDYARVQTIATGVDALLSYLSKHPLDDDVSAAIRLLTNYCLSGTSGD